MNRRHFFAAAVGACLIPFVKVSPPKPALKPWLPKLHPYQIKIFNSDKPVRMIYGRWSGKNLAMEEIWAMEKIAQFEEA